MVFGTEIIGATLALFLTVCAPELPVFGIAETEDECPPHAESDSVSTSADAIAPDDLRI